jgi:uncharacterized membrane protein (UPF0182 family)
MSRKTARLLLIGIGAFILVLIASRAAVGFYTDLLWYHSVGDRAMTRAVTGSRSRGWTAPAAGGSSSGFP